MLALLTTLLLSGCAPTTQNGVLQHNRHQQPKEKTDKTATDAIQILARQRAMLLSDIRYHYRLTLSASGFDGKATIRFNLKRPPQSLQLDLGKMQIRQVSINGAALYPDYDGRQLTLPAALLTRGSNNVSLLFKGHYRKQQPGLNIITDPRDQHHYLYPKFQPTGAGNFLPLFDSPGLRAAFQLDVTAPANWQVISISTPTSCSLSAPQLQSQMTSQPQTQLQQQCHSFSAASLPPAGLSLYAGPFVRSALNTHPQLGLYLTASDAHRLLPIPATAKPALHQQQITADVTSTVISEPEVTNTNATATSKQPETDSSLESGLTTSPPLAPKAPVATEAPTWNRLLLQQSAKRIQQLQMRLQQPLPFGKYDQILLPANWHLGTLSTAGVSALSLPAPANNTSKDARPDTDATRLYRDGLLNRDTALLRQWFGQLTTPTGAYSQWLDAPLSKALALNLAQQAVEPASDKNHLHRPQHATQALKIDIDTNTSTNTSTNNINNSAAIVASRDMNSQAQKASDTDINTKTDNGWVLQTAVMPTYTLTDSGSMMQHSPAMALKHLLSQLGTQRLNQTLQYYLARGTGQTSSNADFIQAANKATSQDIRPWLQDAVYRHGRSIIQASLQCEGGVITKLTITQQPENDQALRRQPLSIGLFVTDRAGIHLNRRIDVALNGAQTQVQAVQNRLCPDFIWPDLTDNSDIRVIPDKHSLGRSFNRLGQFSDPKVAQQLWRSLWHNVLDGHYPAKHYLAALLVNAPQITDLALTALLTRQITTLYQLLAATQPHHGSDAAHAMTALAELCLQRAMETSAQPQLQQAWLNTYIALANRPGELAHLASLLARPVGSQHLPRLSAAQRFAVLQQLKRFDYPAVDKLIRRYGDHPLSLQQQKVLQAVIPSAKIKRELLAQLSTMSPSLRQAVAANLYPPEQQLLSAASSDMRIAALSGHNAKHASAQTDQVNLPLDLAAGLTPANCSHLGLYQLQQLQRQPLPPPLYQAVSAHITWIQQCLLLRQAFAPAIPALQQSEITD